MDEQCQCHKLVTSKNVKNSTDKELIRERQWKIQNNRKQLRVVIQGLSARTFSSRMYGKLWEHVA